jgi:hypothetical protein
MRRSRVREREGDRTPLAATLGKEGWFPFKPSIDMNIPTTALLVPIGPSIMRLWCVTGPLRGWFERLHSLSMAKLRVIHCASKRKPEKGFRAMARKYREIFTSGWCLSLDS